MGTPVSQFTLTPGLLLPWNHEFVVCIWDSFCFVNKSVCTLFLDSTNKWYQWYLSLSDVTSLSVTIFRSILINANGIILLFFKTEQYSIVYVYHVFFIHSSIYGHVGCLTVLAFATVNIGVHISFWIMVFSEYVPRSGLLDHMVALFSVF